MCTECGRKTSVTAGTIFHRTRTPLSTWFAAIWFVTAQKNGIAATNLQQIMGFGSYETAWAWLHKLRRAMVRPDRERLSGVVEIDETYVGGRSRGPGKDGGGTDKSMVGVAVERVGTQRLGRIRLATVGPGTKELLLSFARTVVTPGSEIRTDGRSSYRGLSTLDYVHTPINLSAAVEPAHVELPGVHRVASLLKRWLAGTMHHGYSTDHLNYYLDEFTFRFNRRTFSRRGMLFYRLLQQAVATDPHPLRVLTTANWQETDFI